MNMAVGKLRHGERNLISDVPGVRVGHCTVDEGSCHTGVTVVMPPPKNPFTEKLTAASCVFNGYGKTLGLVQVDELGTLETPIALTNTLNVGKVHDAMVSYMIGICREDGIELTSVNPVVCECNDSRLSDIARRPVGEKEVFAAIRGASADFEQGAVGAGRGTTCYGMKGGIGSSSRLMDIDGQTFTLGVLVQSNYGAAEDFRPVSVPPGLAESDRGSIILILATDLPLSARQLRRVIRRTSVGMARLGSYIGHGSGEICVGFTTARPKACSDSFLTQTLLREDRMNLPFRAAGECAEEAILQSLWNAEADTALNGKRIPSLREFLKEKR
ncbi:MAG: P1 family peptidase [Clostridia bacterium]|nr:P1 family peptidase [Clostridia bacterium]MCR4577652.1 P1 family peptidase [Clostridiales bacterium]